MRSATPKEAVWTGAIFSTCPRVPVQSRLSSLFVLSTLCQPEPLVDQEERDSMTPGQVIDELKKGNERFRAGKMTRRDYLAEQRSSAKGQYSAAVIPWDADRAVPAESFSIPVSGILHSSPSPAT